MTRLKDLIDIFLQPGELFVGDASFQIRTILGSCVSITLWHPQARVGGMSHFLLPTRTVAVAGQVLDGRYGDEALQWMLKDLRASGVNPRQCLAKVFGGGSPLTLTNDASAVGVLNARVAFATLDKLGVSIVGKSVGGNAGMRIYFENWSGLVLVRSHRERSEA